MYARVLKVSSSEEEVVSTILDGLSLVVRSCLAFEMCPRTFLELDALCVRVMAVLHADTLRVKTNLQKGSNARSGGIAAAVNHRSVGPSNSGIICYRC